MYVYILYICMYVYSMHVLISIDMYTHIFYKYINLCLYVHGHISTHVCGYKSNYI